VKEHTLQVSWIALGLGLVCVAGCRKTSDTWNCFNAERQACSQWTGAGMEVGTLSQQQESCREMGGTVVEGPCPEENVVGSCLGGGGDVTRIVYYAPRNELQARHTCTALGGTWR
jgi:hypothetical protein